MEVVPAAFVGYQKNTAGCQRLEPRRPLPWPKQARRAIRCNRFDQRQYLQPTPFGCREMRQNFALHIRVDQRAVRGAELARRATQQDAGDPTLCLRVARSVTPQSLPELGCFIWCKAQVIRFRI